MKKLFTMVAAGLLGALGYSLVQDAIESAENRGYTTAWLEARKQLEEERQDIWNDGFSNGKEQTRLEMEAECERKISEMNLQHENELTEFREACAEEKHRMNLEFAETLAWQDSAWTAYVADTLARQKAASLLWHEQQMEEERGRMNQQVLRSRIGSRKVSHDQSISEALAIFIVFVAASTFLAAAVQGLLRRRRRKRWRI